MDVANPGAAPRRWPDYAAVWRWHFYAGLFCLPFICWLAVTGSVYLFRPDIEALLDRPYESLRLDGPRAPPASEAQAAVTAVPGSAFSRYQPPATATGAAQVLVARDGELIRVYVDPGTLQPMSIEPENRRVMNLVAHLHGQLLLGNRGSMLVELAASWAVVMILTGLWLWWPRGRRGWGGLLYPRLRLRGRLLWRDLHAVTGLWVSGITLFLLLSGLPWSSNWGNYLNWARNMWSVTAGAPDWPVGATDQPAAHRNVVRATPTTRPGTMPGMTTAEMAEMSRPAAQAGEIDRRPIPDLGALNRIVPLAATLHVPPPVWIASHAPGLRDWTISSQAQNRPLRVTYMVDPANAAVTGVRRFSDENVVDRMVNVAVATHEGQLFGRINQAILLLTAASLLVVTTSAAVLWWRRRPFGVLGAPRIMAPPRFSGLLAVAVLALAILLPLFGLSLVAVLVAERAVLPHLPRAAGWLGVRSRPPSTPT